VALEELRRQFRQRLSEEERRLVDLRAEGLSWEQIAALVPGQPKPHALRVRLARACERVLRELDPDS
jgi:hypothetical protein